MRVSVLRKFDGCTANELAVVERTAKRKGNPRKGISHYTTVTYKGNEYKTFVLSSSYGTTSPTCISI